MNSESKIEILNSSGKDLLLQLEPWAEQFVLLPTNKLSISAQAQQPGVFEVEYLDIFLVDPDGFRVHRQTQSNVPGF